MTDKSYTVAHVTHEAVEQLGGIGTVLEGLITSPVYQSQVGRTILIGPIATHMATDPRHRLGDFGKVLYSSIDNIDEAGLSAKFKPVEWSFNVAIVYGTRQFAPPGQGRVGQCEVLLIDVFRTNPDRLDVFKLRLWERFGLDSSRYENAWEYEEYVRLAEPAFYALEALLDEDELPCILLAHEYMGMPSALAAILEGGDRYRTVFHAHECSTARRIVEGHPGHDVMFYNVLDQARDQGLYMDDVFGDQDGNCRHALVSRTYLCDGIIAVGDRTRDELRFLSSKFDDKPIEVAYNGVPAHAVDMPAKQHSRRMLLDYSAALFDDEPDVLMTHVTRPVISKGLWRDLRVCHVLDAHFAREGLTGVLYLLTSGGGVRRPHDITAMQSNYGWPGHHRPGYPDLVGPEQDLFNMIEPFNTRHHNIRIVLVNQFGWSPRRIGRHVPTGMDMGNFRHATDVEFGMATYEPFGISPLEPLASGAVCVISRVCGCERFVESITGSQGSPNVLVADFVHLSKPRTIEQLLAMDQIQRDRIETAEAACVADKLFERIPRNDDQRQALLESGQQLVAQMGWDQVIAQRLLPLFGRIIAEQSHGTFEKLPAVAATTAL